LPLVRPRNNLEAVIAKPLSPIHSRLHMTAGPRISQRNCMSGSGRLRHFAERSRLFREMPRRLADLSSRVKTSGLERGPAPVAQSRKPTPIFSKSTHCGYPGLRKATTSLANTGHPQLAALSHALDSLPPLGRSGRRRLGWGRDSRRMGIGPLRLRGYGLRLVAGDKIRGARNRLDI
jgi:hypothetical protein